MCFLKFLFLMHVVFASFLFLFPFRKITVVGWPRVYTLPFIVSSNPGKYQFVLSIPWTSLISRIGEGKHGEETWTISNSDAGILCGFQKRFDFLTPEGGPSHIFRWKRKNIITHIVSYFLYPVRFYSIHKYYPTSFLIESCYYYYFGQ